MPKRDTALFLALCFVGAHFWWLMAHCPPTYQGPDANGYYVQVELLANHGRTELQPESPLAFIGGHWLGRVHHQGEPEEYETFHSRYPPGVGWLLALPYRFFGPAVALYVTPLLGSLTLFFLFLLCRPHVGAPLALVAMALYGFQPAANSQALNWGAHTQVGFFLMLGLYFLDGWSRKPTWWRVFLAGLCLGALPTLRLGEIAAGLGVAAFLLYHTIRKGEIRTHHKKHLLIAVSGAIIPIAALMVHNHGAFGSVFATGYSLTGEQQAGAGFAWRYFLASWRPYTEMLMSNGAGLFFGLGVVGTFGMLFSPRARGMGLLILGVVAPVTLTYMAYYFGNSLNAIRFFLPTLPLYTLPALWMVHQLAARKRVAFGAALALLGLQGALWLPETLERAVWDDDRLTRMNDAVVFLDKHLPEDSVLITDSKLAPTMQYYPKWTVLDSRLLSHDGRPPRDTTDSGNTGTSRVDRNDPSDRSDKEGAPPQSASPVQRGKGAVFRKELNAVRGVARRELIVDYLEELRASKKGGIYWMMTVSGNLRGGGGDLRAAMRRLEFANGDKFKLVDSVRLSETRRTVNRNRSEREYQELHGEPPPRGQRRRRRFLSRMDRWEREIGSRMGPLPGQRYRLFKLAGEGRE